MKCLTSYIFDKLYVPSIDAHIHCIGGEDVPRTADIQVCALNDWPDTPRLKNYPEYNKFFKNKEPQDLVIAIGADTDEMIKMITDKRFDGFGEFLAYKITNNGDIVKNMNLVKKISDMTPKPIYVHYDLLPNNVDIFDNFLKTTTNRNIVLAHCGLSRHTDDDVAWNFFIKLINENTNLYGDISWHTLTYITDHIDLIKSCPQSRIICGTDCSERDSEKTLNHRKENFDKISSMIPNTYNIKRLFHKV